MLAHYDFPDNLDPDGWDVHAREVSADAGRVLARVLQRDEDRPVELDDDYERTDQ